MTIPTRREHLAAAKVRSRELDSFAGRIGLAVKYRWRSWLKHPFANGIYWWWTHVPHKPKMRLEVMSTGYVNHELKDADWAVFSDHCTRCGWEDPDSIVEAWPAYAADIKAYFEARYSAEEYALEFPDGDEDYPGDDRRYDFIDMMDEHGGEG
jgi:hypothetical protein